MSLPVIVIAGRPNVGKSTLFNYLTRSRDAIVADMPGVTRDRQYGRGQHNGQEFIVVDTGGLGALPEADDLGQQLQSMTTVQAEQAMQEADHILHLVDAKSGLTADDLIIIEQLRKQSIPWHLVINKADRLNATEACADFFALGVEPMHVIAANNGRGIDDLLQQLKLDQHQSPQAEVIVPNDQPDLAPAQPPAPLRIAMLGRPNVGKSTLINSMLGEERVMVYDAPGTTRDSISIPFTRHEQDYILIDTAGIRRRAKIQQAVEKFSIIKSLQAMQQADICICVIDASVGLHEQDLRLLQQAVSHAKAIVIAFNKWDCLDKLERENFKQEVDRRLAFMHFARRYHISALHGSGLGDLYRAIAESQAALSQDFSTGCLSKWLERAATAHQPPLAQGRRIRLRFAHIGGKHPLTIIIHGKQLTRLAGSYKRYLVSFFQKKLNLIGIPLHLEFKNDHNPYVDENKKIKPQNAIDQNFTMMWNKLF